MKLKILVQDRAKRADASGARKIFDFDDAYCVIGREQASLILTDPRCSRQHAILFESLEGTLRVRDLGSTNGTLLHGKRLDESELKKGDELRIGKVSLTLLDFIPVAVTPAKPAAAKPAVAPQVPAEALTTEDTQTQTGIVVHGSKSLFKCLPDNQKAEFLDYVDGHGTQTRIRLAEILDKKKTGT